MKSTTFKSFAITISLADEQDFAGDIQEWFIKWLTKQDYAYAVTEYDSSHKLHCHAQIWNNNPSKKGDLFGTAFKQKILKYNPNAVVLGNQGALKVKIAYNDYYVEYQQKDIVEELFSNLPQLTDQFYPSLEEQQFVQAEAKAINKTEFRWKTLWIEHYSKLGEPLPPKPRYQDVVAFILQCMFTDDTIKIIYDSKLRISKIRCFYYYLIKYAPESYGMSKEDHLKIFPQLYQ